MDNVLKPYKGYSGYVHYSPTDEIFYGKIEAIADLVTFEADSAKQLRLEFEAAVDDYLAYCREEGKEPNKPFKGVFNVRVGADLHRKAVLVALAKGMKLNELVTKAVVRFVEEPAYI